MELFFEELLLARDERRSHPALHLVNPFLRDGQQILLALVVELEAEQAPRRDRTEPYVGMIDESPARGVSRGVGLLFERLCPIAAARGDALHVPFLPVGIPICDEHIAAHERKQRGQLFNLAGQLRPSACARRASSRSTCARPNSERFLLSSLSARLSRLWSRSACRRRL